MVIIIGVRMKRRILQKDDTVVNFVNFDKRRLSRILPISNL